MVFCCLLSGCDVEVVVLLIPCSTAVGGPGEARGGDELRDD